MLDVDALLAQAAAETGLDDFGDEEFHDALRRYVDLTNRGMKLSALGAMAVPAEIHRILVNRLRFAEDLKRHPEILDEKLDDPIVILGLPRTGTTKLQRLLAACPDTQGLRYWQIANPARFPDAQPGEEDPRLEAGRQMLAMLGETAPGILQSHAIQLHDVDEEIFLQLFTFKSLGTWLSHPAPGYREWLSTQSLAGTYAYMKRLFQYLQWQDGGRCERPWILKTPVHLGALDILVETFPEATLVCTHRNLHEVIPSFCRLVEQFWRIRSDDVDQHAVGDAMLEVWSAEIRKHFALRERLGARADILDVRYERVRDDAFGVAADVLARIGRALTPERRQAMEDWQAQDAYGRFGEARYTLEEYGLTRERIDAAFADYIDWMRFAL